MCIIYLYIIHIIYINLFIAFAYLKGGSGAAATCSGVRVGRAACLC